MVDVIASKLLVPCRHHNPRPKSERVRKLDSRSSGPRFFDPWYIYDRLFYVLYHFTARGNLPTMRFDFTSLS